jgi:hypothetical protein
LRVYPVFSPRFLFKYPDRNRQLYAHIRNGGNQRANSPGVGKFSKKNVTNELMGNLLFEIPYSVKKIDQSTTKTKKKKKSTIFVSVLLRQSLYVCQIFVTEDIIYSNKLFDNSPDEEECKNK